MDVKLSILIVVIFIGGSCTNSSTYQRANKERTGEYIYTLNCSICHGNDGNLGVGGAKQLSVSTFEVSQIEHIIEKGSNGMPSFEGRLTSVEINKVTEHIKSLRK